MSAAKPNNSSTEPAEQLPLPLDAALFYPFGSHAQVQLLQTHIGWVYLVGEYAFKLKKRVRFDFLDFSKLEGRRWACEREILLNRRLCPDLYLGLIPVYETAGGKVCIDFARVELASPDFSAKISTKSPKIPADATLKDWIVWMRRLPEERMLDRLLTDSAPVNVIEIEHIADMLASFYTVQRGGIPAGGLGDWDAVSVNVSENLREGLTLDRSLLSAGELQYLEKRARYFLDRHGEIVRRRAREGFVVDGHGDLKTDNICLPAGGPPLLFDCIEFNDRFRICDSAMDVAFLAMDLAFRGREDLSRAFLARYKNRCDSELPDKLLNFYLGYRAFVKGKVAAWIVADKNVGQAQREKAAADARGYFDLAIRYALLDQPVLLLFCGPAGSGKSTLAARLSGRLNCAHFATDLVRDTQIPRGLPPEQRYAPAISASVYQALLAQADSSLANRKPVVLDGTFSSPSTRAAAVKVAQARGAASIVVWADCPPENAAGHIGERMRSGQTFGSEATEKIAQSQQKIFVPPRESEGFQSICRVDTSRPLEESHRAAWEQVLAALAKCGASL